MKNQILLLFLLSITSICISQNNTPLNIKTGCVSGNCDNGFGIYVFESGSIYIGNFKNTLKQGRGVYYFATGDSYNGDWDSSKISGYGTYYFKAGMIYDGMFDHGKRSGFGVYYNANGSVNYAGEWNSDKQVSFPKDKPGCHSGDCVNGFGTYIWATGEVYNGTFKNNVPDGDGIFFNATGDIWEGQFNQGKGDGWGSYFLKTGSYYQGEMKDGVYSGFGTLYNSDGSVYHIGNWKDGKIADSTAIKSGITWENQETRIIKGIYDNGDKYTGKLINSKPDSIGRYVNKDGDVFDCQFINGKPQGYGMFKYSTTGIWFIGQVSGTTLNGTGVLFNKDGTVNSSGEWKNNIMIDNNASKAIKEDKSKFHTVKDDFSDALNKIIDDYPNYFKNITAGKDDDDDELKYLSKVILPGCTEARIEPDSSVHEWAAMIITTADKDIAWKTYRDFVKKIDESVLNCCEFYKELDTKEYMPQFPYKMYYTDWSPDTYSDGYSEKKFGDLIISLELSTTYNDKMILKISISEDLD